MNSKKQSKVCALIIEKKIVLVFWKECHENKKSPQFLAGFFLY